MIGISNESVGGYPMMGGWGGGWGGGDLLGAVVLSTLFNRNGNNCNDGHPYPYPAPYPTPYCNPCCDKADVANQTIAMLQSQQTQTCCINDEVGDVKDAMTYGFSNVKDAIHNLGTSFMQSQYAQTNAMNCQTNTIVGAINCGVQSIKDIMCQNEKDELRRQLAIAENGGPIVRAGAYVFSNPCHDNKWKSDIDQFVVQIGQTNTAILGALQALAK